MTRPTRLVVGLLALSSLPALAGQRLETIVSKGNPILADGRYYSTDPAPLVDGGRIVKRRSDQNHLYAPVLQRGGPGKDRFAIGAAPAASRIAARITA